ncbi:MULTISPECIES: membrane lipoprotein lipid attachment site-containing protein [Dickeya]|uniref:Type IV secretion system putative lipoprotein virB7 n=1 Tax=Dickeya solani TaxID=1089444 RepID=A0ABU4EGZ6_9GAMM|nr:MULTISPECIES: membrane lipoprotein lipid attachment site-containing protein [Dickeya]MCA7000051.1 membrane lipoprotein lipid attachment site-containing protein [Dickeya solani]MCZ0821342.1 membrane lipoprotein lipid attachment site-containing protein [Dickeya solani]MDV6995328.1 membrane lipoprotein lipid attachment site-containing protein [Dickeya solani]MDV7004950.1 membrane lipoprotein lipid attachment site-containing protein [Dickeya solani]MDV7040072.1 membrane lipoprotein lipid attach
MKKILLVAGVALVLAGCGEKGDFEKAINAKISKSKVCYSLQNNDFAFNKGFPIKVNRGYRSAGYSASDEILNGLVEQGLLNVSQQANGFSSVDVLEVTDKGQEVEFWNREEGACVGHRAVAEVKSWTEPSEGNGVKMTQVIYTWKLDGVPGWVDKKAFSGVKGMAEPEETTIVLVKTNNGWAAR